MYVYTHYPAEAHLNWTVENFNKDQATRFLFLPDPDVSHLLPAWTCYAFGDAFLLSRGVTRGYLSSNNLPVSSKCSTYSFLTSLITFLKYFSYCSVSEILETGKNPRRSAVSKNLSVWHKTHQNNIFPPVLMFVD